MKPYPHALGLKIIFKGVATNPATEEENPTTTLIQVFQGGSLQGTWIHPQVAIHLAMWLNPDFAVLVTEWVVTWMSAGINPTQPQPHSQQPQPEQPKKLPWKPLELFPAMSEETFKSLDAISRQHFAETSAERAIRIQKERTEEMLWCNQYQYKQYFPK
ncbi:MAG: KilA-N domain-containing protein [Crinalium sp.]